MKTILFSLFVMIPQMGLAYITQLPENCLKNKSFPCVVRAYKKTYFKEQGMTFYLARGSLIELSSLKELQIHHGYVWMQSPHSLVVRGPFGSIESSTVPSQIFVESGEQEWAVRALEGDFVVQSRGAKDKVDLPSGFEVMLSGVGPFEKESFVSLPIVMHLKNHLKGISKVFPFLDYNFKEYVDAWGLLAVTAADKNSSWHKTIVERKIAHVEREKVRRKYESEYNSRRDTYLRSVFRKKNSFLDE